MATIALRRLRLFHQTATAFMTWLAMCGNGPATGTVMITIGLLPHRDLSPEILKVRATVLIQVNQASKRKSTKEGHSSAPSSTVRAISQVAVARANRIPARTTWDFALCGTQIDTEFEMSN